MTGSVGQFLHRGRGHLWYEVILRNGDENIMDRTYKQRGSFEENGN